jgi:ElaB/YqjD/DUF883 family membrane-anchored ribosome-binding protein
MSNLNGKTSADLEREVDEQRGRVEARIGAIKERLSPGQLIDEALSYTKSGGAQFASTLGQQISANPLPAALVGVGLAWLISTSVGSSGTPQPRAVEDDTDYPYGRASSLRRTSHAADESGQWWSEFETDSGDTFRAKATEQGQRAGHFVDATGRKFGGFIDDTGQRVRRFQDEAGNMLDSASGWANHGWSEARRGVGEQFRNAADTASQIGDSVVSGTRDLGGTMQTQADRLTSQLTTLFDRQPLIAGALAFAAGAALGAALPHTDQEDALLGEEADKIRDQTAEAAGSLYGQGKEQIADAYAKVSDAAAEVYDTARDQASRAVDGREARPSNT